MRDITPSLFIGIADEARTATFKVTYVESARQASEVINSGGTAMLPTEAMAKQTLELLGCPPEQVEYLLSWYPDAVSISLPEP